MKAVFWLGIMVLTQISRSRFNFWGILGDKGLVKFKEIGNFKDLMLF